MRGGGGEREWQTGIAGCSTRGGNTATTVVMTIYRAYGSHNGTRDTRRGSNRTASLVVWFTGSRAVSRVYNYLIDAVHGAGECGDERTGGVDLWSTKE